MTKDEMQQIRDALFNGTIAAVNTDEDVAMYQNALAILDAELAKPEQEPVAWMGYSGVGEKIVSPKAIYSWMTIPLYTAPVPTPQRECETCARKRERLLKAGFLKSPLRAKNEEKNT